MQVLDLRSSECDVVSLYVCVSLLMDLFVLCVSQCTQQFAKYMGVVATLLLNVMKAVSVCGGALLDIPCMVFQ